MIIPEPSATPVTTPALETVASAVLDDAHVARLVTSCDVPSDIAAVALNCDAVPRAGAAPETLIDETVADDDKGEEEHPTANAASPTTIANELNQRTIDFLPCNSAGIAMLRTPTGEQPLCHLQCAALTSAVVSLSVEHCGASGVNTFMKIGSTTSLLSSEEACNCHPKQTGSHRTWRQHSWHSQPHSP